MKANIILYCITGFGDQYSNILTGYKSYVDLTNLGYDVELSWMINNLYYSSDLPLDYLYDFSFFYNKNVKINYIQHESQIPNDLIFLPTNQNAIKIYVSEIINELIDYELPVFDYFGFHRNSYNVYNPEKLPDFSRQFISEEVLNIANKFVDNQQKINAIHFRCGDSENYLNYDEVIKDEFFKTRAKLACEFIESNPNNEIMVCSSNKNVRDYFCDNFKNTFYNKFDNDLELHYSYNKLFDESINIRHAQQIVSEMTLFSKCDKIFTIGRSLSNFLTYGVAHNIHHNNWQTKIKDLIIN